MKATSTKRNASRIYLLLVPLLVIIFGSICDTLESINLNEISQMMRVPFDCLTREELLDSFSDIGFSNSQLSIQEKYLFLAGGVDGAMRFVYATPIGPKLTALGSEKQEEFKEIFTQNIQGLIHTDGKVGRMVTNVLILEK